MNEQYPINIGPIKESDYLSTGLDFYKPTMSQLAFEKHKDAEVTFTFKNRGKNRLAEYVDVVELQTRLDARRNGWNPEEIAYLASLTHQNGDAVFSEEYLDYLTDNPLPSVDVILDEDGDIAIDSSGTWPMVTFWETVVMSEVNELYFENMVRQERLNLFDIYKEGDSRLTDKIAKLQSRPDIKFADFGTRRRFSYRWQQYVLERLLTECPDNIVGTSNVYLANKFDVKPIGTFAHEMPMVYAGLADADGRNPLEGHGEMLVDWYTFYNGNLDTALTDTFTSEYFFTDFTEEQAADWSALRHDSGDPVEFGNRVIKFYKDFGINPMEKTIVFSDGLDIDTIIMLADTFAGKINLLFGWGTTLTNDLGIKALNIVMKATKVNGVSTVKLSDNPEKNTGLEAYVNRYNAAVAQAVGQQAVALAI